MTRGGSPGTGALLAALPWIALLLIASLAWVFLILGERSMGEAGVLGAFMHRAMRPADVVPYLATTSVMWLVMMIAMMVPAVVPMARAVERIGRGYGKTGGPLFFAGGYLVAWSAFALLAAGLQWCLHRSGWLHGHALSLSPAVGGGVLLCAGIYQLTPLKEACLTHCRGPLRFVLEHWQPGRGGALRMGIRHGLYCVGCCWLLMLLMFAGGAMSVLWMAALSAFIIAERVLPGGPWVARIPGAALAGAGGWLWLGGLG